MSAFADAFVNLNAISEEHGEDIEPLLEQYGVSEEERLPICLFASVRARHGIDSIADDEDPELVIAGAIMYGVLAGLAFARELESNAA